LPRKIVSWTPRVQGEGQL